MADLICKSIARNLVHSGEEQSIPFESEPAEKVAFMEHSNTLITPKKKYQKSQSPFGKFGVGLHQNPADCNAQTTHVLPKGV